MTYPTVDEDLAWLDYVDAQYEAWLETQPDIEDEDWEDEYDRAAAADEYDRY